MLVVGFEQDRTPLSRGNFNRRAMKVRLEMLQLHGINHYDGTGSGDRSFVYGYEHDINLVRAWEVLVGEEVSLC